MNDRLLHRLNTAIADIKPRLANVPPGMTRISDILFVGAINEHTERETTVRFIEFMEEIARTLDVPAPTKAAVPQIPGQQQFDFDS